MTIVLVHGYNVTSTNTYGVLPKRLKSMGHSVKDVYIGKYVTLDNDLNLSDLIKAFDTALRDALGKNLDLKKFVCITHSTGGLVVRGWISAYYEKRMRACPISHFIMLAPPNHGSRLASLGKSRLSRLRSLWGVEPGLRILDALELGSSYQAELNGRWIENNTHQAPGFYPVVITGQWIDKKIWDVIVPATYERGSDGVVRAAAANLNAKRFLVGADRTSKKQEVSEIPFLIAPRASHSEGNFGVMGSIPENGDHPVLTAIRQVLAVKDRRSYKALAADFQRTTKTLQQTEPYHDGTPLSRYCQLVIRVTDTLGNSLKDYALELIDFERRGDRLPGGFLAHSCRNSVAAERFVYYLDYDRVSQVIGGALGIRVQSVPNSPLVRYDDFVFEGPLTKISSLLAPNQTTYVDVVLKRRLNKKVFQLTTNLSYQKINRIPSADWID